MIKRNRKLILYAFNGECDSIISKVKWNNATKMEERIEKAFKDINKLGEVFSIYITDYFKNLKIEELSLTHEYEEKKYQEKEEQKRIREQMREEDRAQKELEKEQREAEDEEKRFQKALDKARKELGSVSQNELEELNKQISSLEQRLKDAHERKERALSMAQMTKVGHIYVISNIGSFGVGVVKIGMTRRLDPLDRVKELGDASVPFQFDIHAIIHSENAPELERQLHKKFQDQRLNRINSRKEFFRVGLEEIEEFVKGHLNAQIEFTLLAEAREYRETIYLSNTPLDTSLETTNEKEFPKSLLSK
jgi:Rad3-related DNA helicase